MIIDSILYSILDSTPNNSTPILQFSDLASTQLRLQTFMIWLENESLVGTPIRRFLVSVCVFCVQTINVWSLCVSVRRTLLRPMMLCFTFVRLPKYWNCVPQKELYKFVLNNLRDMGFQYWSLLDSRGQFFNNIKILEQC